MVVLSRIYTKTGDDGTTALGDGRRVRKDAARIEAFGTVDELNSVLGLALCAGPDGDGATLLKSIQNDLFDLGADLCVPEVRRRGLSARASGRPPLRITEEQTRRLERAIDRINAPLGVLRSFVLPGGTPASAWLHLARTVCRRAERRVIALARREKVNRQAVVYLNRLSDLLFVMARRANDGGRADVLWVPGRGAGND
ncbi:MAG: cob(I)yrinic acid a,c-diamide adenosyltransferase [Acidobacteria bacterium]|nr:MAG: cob(I)yrinic acid a,c-diamide adenosyltransferase [Acidobacteriota bacterium]